MYISTMLFWSPILNHAQNPKQQELEQTCSETPKNMNLFFILKKSINLLSK